MQLLSFNDIALPDRMATYEIPTTTVASRMDITGTRIGGYVLGVRHETRKYVANGLYLRDSPDDAITDRTIDQLRGAMGALGVLRQKMRDGSVRRCNAWLTKCQATHDNQSSATRAQPVALEFESDSFWHEDVLSVAEFVGKTTVYAVNSGNAPTTQLRITITSAIASTLTITNQTNGQAITYGAAKANGAVLAIDSSAGTVTVDGVNAYGNTSRADTQMELLSLAAGQNKLIFNPAVSGKIEYRGCWV